MLIFRLTCPPVIHTVVLLLANGKRDRDESEKAEESELHFDF